MVKFAGYGYPRCNSALLKNCQKCILLIPYQVMNYVIYFQAMSCFAYWKLPKIAVQKSVLLVDNLWEKWRLV